eukprot:94746-Alexandrium_andersonii.AAC.1
MRASSRRRRIQTRTRSSASVRSAPSPSPTCRLRDAAERDPMLASLNRDGRQTMSSLESDTWLNGVPSRRR